jgi:hypothetical protein
MKNFYGILLLNVSNYQKPIQFYKYEINIFKRNTFVNHIFKRTKQQTH